MPDLASVIFWRKKISDGSAQTLRPMFSPSPKFITRYHLLVGSGHSFPRPHTAKENSRSSGQRGCAPLWTPRVALRAAGAAAPATPQRRKFTRHQKPPPCLMASSGVPPSRRSFGCGSPPLPLTAGTGDQLGSINPRSEAYSGGVYSGFYSAPCGAKMPLFGRGG